jgi:hypothetical protein
MPGSRFLLAISLLLPTDTVTESLPAETAFCHTVAQLHRRRAVTWLLREVRAQNELALETTRLETTVWLSDLIEGDPLGDARHGARSVRTIVEERAATLQQAFGSLCFIPQ